MKGDFPMKNPKLYVFVHYTFHPSYTELGARNSLYWLLDAMIDYPDMKYSQQCKVAAEHRKRTVRTIQRNIQQLNDFFWERERLLLFEMAGSCLKEKPTIKEFLQILLDEFERIDGKPETRFGSTTLREPNKR